MMAFCWLPPESCPIGRFDARGLDAQRRDQLLRDRALLGERQELREAHARLQRERDVLAHREVGDDAAVLAILGAEPEAESQRIRRVIELRRLAVDA